MERLDGILRDVPNDIMSTGKRVRALRDLLDLTQKEVEERSGGAIAQEILSKVEADKNKLNGRKSMEGLARAFGLRPDQLASYIDGKTSLEETARLSREPDAAVPAFDPPPALVEDSQSAVEAALGQAFDAKIHTLKDLDAVRSSVRSIHKLEAEHADAVEAARTWLDAAARLRRAGKVVDVNTLLVAVTLGTKALPQQIERQEQRDAQMTEEAAEQLRAMGGEPGQGAEMGDRLKRLAKKAQREE